jgi:hypothetical protein
VYAAFYGQSWGEGGNGLEWKHEINSPEQLQAMGWQKTGRLRVRHSNPKFEEHPAWTVYSRYCRQGETFTLRNHKYVAPILIWGDAEKTVSRATPNATPVFSGSSIGGFGPALTDRAPN